MVANEYRVSLGGDENVLKIDMVMIMHICECIKTH